MFTQKEIYDYLLANPLGVDVHIGDLEDLQGRDYIFFDYTSDQLIGSDDSGCYLSLVQFAVATKDFDSRRVLVRFIKDKFNVSVTYDRSDEFEYYVAYCTCGILIEVA